MTNESAMLQELYDKLKIREVVTNYCRAVDRMDRDLLMSVYHPDGIDDHGFFVGGREDFWTWVNNYHMQAQSVTQHIITNHSCDLDGDTAHTETYWMMAGMSPDRSKLSLGGGRYIDRLEKRDGEWRIVARKCVPEWGGTPAPSAVPAEAMAMLAQSGTVARDRTDSSYERPLTVPAERVGINVDILKL
jgi:hypothetical protein